MGVLIDDLTTKGTEEPYRMFTSRVEYRLIIREDNADRRLCAYGHQFGLVDDQDYNKVVEKYRSIDAEVEHLRNTRISPGTALDQILSDQKSSPLRQPTTLSAILKRPEVKYHMIAPFDGKLKDFPQSVIDHVEYEIKYEGFIQRQYKSVQRFRHIENIKIPVDFDYLHLPGLSAEIQQKLKAVSPATLGQANRISGVTPAAITILMIYLRKLSLERQQQKKQGTQVSSTD